MAVLSGTPSIFSDSSDSVVSVLSPKISESEFDSLGSTVEWKKSYVYQKLKF